MWAGVSNTQGEAFYIPSIVGASIASFITAPLDLAGTAAVDASLIVSYPIRVMVGGDKHSWVKGYKLTQALQSKEHKIKVISNKNFNRLVADLREKL